MRPMPRTAAAADECVPSLWSRGRRRSPNRALAEPPTRAAPMSTITTVSSSLLMRRLYNDRYPDGLRRGAAGDANRSFGAHAAHLRCCDLRCSLTHPRDARVPLLG